MLAAMWQYIGRGARPLSEPQQVPLFLSFIPHLPPAHNAIGKMAAKLKSQVFWISYQPGTDETAEDVLRIARKVMNGLPGVCGDVKVRDGQPMVDMVVCTPTPQRVSVISQKSKWDLKGAKGRVCDARWPAERESPRAFLRKWADAVTRQPRAPFGSREEVFRALDIHYERERRRKRDLRLRQRRQRRPPSPVDRPSPPQAVVDIPDPQPTSAEVAELTRDEVGGTSWTFDGFTGVDFGSAAEGWSLRPPHQDRNANRSASQDPFLCREGISASAIDLALAGWGLLITGECDIINNVECDVDFGRDCNAEVLGMDVNLDWNPEWNSLLDEIDLVV